jgi:putative ubiquitin-RnfH superfamily antitoxin RatB of RatAB toxin-antitoxin module
MKFSVAHAQGAKGHWLMQERPEPVSVLEAISLSPLLSLYPELDVNTCKFGVFGKICAPTTQVKEGDRVEIYLPVQRVEEDDDDDDDD